MIDFGKVTKWTSSFYKDFSNKTCIHLDSPFGINKAVGALKVAVRVKLGTMQESHTLCNVG